MQRTAGLSESEQQAAGSILIIRIVFNNSGLRSNLSDFSIADIALNSALKGVAAESECADYSGSLRLGQYEGKRVEDRSAYGKQSDRRGKCEETR